MSETMISYGIKASERGAEVNKATPEDSSLDTRLPMLMIESSGTVSSHYPGAADGVAVIDTVTIPHNLGHEPAFYVWGYRDEEAAIHGGRIAVQAGGTFMYGGGVFYAESDKQNLYIRMRNPEAFGTPVAEPAFDWVAFYYIFKNQVDIDGLDKNKSIYYDKDKE
jgi:hypothetical protein